LRFLTWPLDNVDSMGATENAGPENAGPSKM